VRAAAMKNQGGTLAALVPLGIARPHAMVDRHVAEPMDWVQHRDWKKKIQHESAMWMGAQADRGQSGLCT
jgi:hypothetical protein